MHRKLGTRVCCEAVRSAILATAWLLVLLCYSCQLLKASIQNAEHISVGAYRLTSEIVFAGGSLMAWIGLDLAKWTHVQLWQYSLRVGRDEGQWTHLLLLFVLRQYCRPARGVGRYFCTKETKQCMMSIKLRSSNNNVNIATASAVHSWRGWGWAPGSFDSSIHCLFNFPLLVVIPL